MTALFYKKGTIRHSSKGINIQRLAGHCIIFSHITDSCYYVFRCLYELRPPRLSANLQDEVEDTLLRLSSFSIIARGSFHAHQPIALASVGHICSCDSFSTRWIRIHAGDITWAWLWLVANHCKIFPSWIWPTHCVDNATRILAMRIILHSKYLLRMKILCQLLSTREIMFIKV